MLIKTILNRVHKLKSFVYNRVEIVDEPAGAALLIHIMPRANSRPICSKCHKPCAGYDTLAPRRFEFVPMWAITVFFVYSMRRVNCPVYGVVVEQVEWAKGKHHLTDTYAWFLARWAKRLCFKDVAQAFGASWSTVFRAVKMAVAWGLVHRSLEQITAIGVDEIQWEKGHKYLTLVYQIDNGAKRLLWIGANRTEATLNEFFHMLGKQRCQKIRFVCSDMWKPYLTVIAQKFGQALNILDRYHIMAQMNKAIDQIRSKEAKAMLSKGLAPILKHTRWLLLKRPENLTEEQDTKLSDLLKYNLKAVRSYLLKEEFQQFW